MAEAPAKKLKLPLYLNPVVSRPDEVAMAALEQWYEQTKESCGGPGPEVEALIREFHRDLYLAGLHLYLINPRLCRHVAEALQQPDPSAETLDQELKACGLWPSSNSSNTGEAFSSGQLEQLQHLLGGLGTAADSSSQSAELSQHMSAMEAELRQLRNLVEEQSRQLRQMKVSPTETAAPAISLDDKTEEMDVSGMSGQIEKMQKIRKKGVF